MSVLIVCNDGTRVGRDIEAQLGVVGCVIGFDYIIASETGEIDGETKFPIFQECSRVVLNDIPVVAARTGRAIV